jgi:ribosome-associated translation inhibitor RaiA
MELPVQVTFRNMPPSPAVEADIRDRARKLERFYDRTVSCRVALDAPHRHRHKGRIYRVRIELGLPRGRLISSGASELAHEHEDVYVAVRDAFRAVRRQLEDRARRLRGAVKTHAVVGR